jgi:hypothetical protein
MWLRKVSVTFWFIYLECLPCLSTISILRMRLALHSRRTPFRRGRKFEVLNLTNIYWLYTGLYNRALARVLSLISKNGQERAGCALYSFTDGPPLRSLHALAHKSMHLQVATGRTRTHGGMSWNTNIISHATKHVLRYRAGTGCSG